MSTSLKDQRVALLMSGAELGRLDQWRFKNHIGSRGEAIRRLIERGLGDDTQMPMGTLAERSSAVAQPVGELPPHIADAIAEHCASRPYLPDYRKAMVDLIQRGLASLEGREELIELTTDVLKGVKEFTGIRTVEETVLVLLSDAIHAWQVQRDIRLEDEED